LNCHPEARRFFAEPKDVNRSASQSVNIFATISAGKNKTVPAGESHRDGFFVF
jgi:hypothetical protein